MRGAEGVDEGTVDKLNIFVGIQTQIPSVDGGEYGNLSFFIPWELN